MAVDFLSPIAPARIRALLLPVGRIKRSRFLAFVELLQPQCMVRLGDVSPDPRPDRNMFSPLAFPGGILLYDLSTSLPPPSHLVLSPFEQFREPLLIIGIADAKEYPQFQPSRAENDSSQDASGTSEQDNDGAEKIRLIVEDLREQFPKAYLHSLMLFDSNLQTRHPQLPLETLLVPPAAELKTTTMKTIMCDLTSTFLAELTSLAKSIQALPTIPSPSSQSGATDTVPSWAGADSTAAQFSRRNSQVPTGSRPESPVSTAQKDLHRMSMPVLPSTSGASLAVEHTGASSPTTEGARTPPTTFDEISGIDAAKALHRSNSNSKANGSVRDPSADRVSIHGFGSGGVGERARNKGRGRVSVIIGTLYLCAGQWHEALKELTEGATLARSCSDHLWHAKALENTMVCLLLFAWSGMDFQIPQICYPISDKSSGIKTPQNTAANNTANAPRASSNEAAIESLNTLLPDLVNMILNVYTRASNFAGESMPSIAFSECVIRFSKLLAAMNLSAGYLDGDALRHLVQNTPFRQKPRLSVPRLSVNPTRNDIASMLFRALPGPPESSGMSPIDRVVVLAGVASVLSSLELQRKKAIVMKEFITSLIPGLVQARKVGAAEMGVHPAAGLAALNMASGSNSGAGALNLGEGEVENGIDEFLGLLGRIYGIPDARGTSSPQSFATTPQDDNPQQTVIKEILRIASLRSFGSAGLKLDILRMCINFCEALPDFNGVLHFTSLLLRLAGPGTAPKPNSTDVFVALSREEQTRLFANISRTVAAANKLGLQHVETEYWDDFLVRGLFIIEEPIPLRLTHHRSAELKSTLSAKKSPFIHNPWNKQPQSSAVETILVANEEYRFVIALQNPYDFELEVESLRIAAKGVEFTAHEEMFLLGPYRTQKFPIAGVALSAGTLDIIGCYIKVIGCRERLFPIFPEPWKPEMELKMKRIGLQACLGAPISRPASAVVTAPELPPRATPKPDTLTFNVIPDQPVVIVTDVSLPQAALMVLEGERKQFTITIKNTSQTTAVDFIHISFQDSATAAIQAATSNRDLPPAELHELEVQLAHHPSLRWCKTEAEETVSVEPGKEASFEIEVVGRPRLTDAVIQIDYASLGKRRSEVTDRFFTRQVSVPISITVNASAQLQRPDIVPLSRDFAWSHQSSRSDDSSPSTTLTPSSILLHKNDAQFQEFLRHAQSQGIGDEYCMLLLDLRNSWPNPLHITLQIRALPSSSDNSDSNEDPEDTWTNSYTVNEIIQPGHINRVVLILPKIYLSDPHAAIPSLNPANQRQFVVSTSKISPEVERATREAFWYRHELLRRIRGTWKEDGEGRRGDLELRTVRFSPRMVEAIKLEDVSISTRIVPDASATEEGETVHQLGRSRFLVPTDTFLTLATKISNRSPTPISPLLRLQPHLANLAHNIALDLDKRLSWSGVLQRRLPTILPGQSVETELGLVVLSSGVYEIGASVDEVEVEVADGEDEGEGQEQGRARSGTETMKIMQGRLLGDSKLRAWFAKEACVVVARRMGEE
ncbi:hypercellular protein-like protein HypA [Lentithecium fluviatile CBS 122367]|uniref:Hypercellular protein-like protein HypA n=1 Tax=Lentithecium fluviatile CBS 122367 TaxID=1168545 RepID=A0A6G1JFR2_9PLEO|nr:hypercellular protein-like protein HypA [Lentithecium fluviatile CBS 122367]